MKKQEAVRSLINEGIYPCVADRLPEGIEPIDKAWETDLYVTLHRLVESFPKIRNMVEARDKHALHEMYTVVRAPDTPWAVEPPAGARQMLSAFPLFSLELLGDLPPNTEDLVWSCLSSILRLL